MKSVTLRYLGTQKIQVLHSQLQYVERFQQIQLLRVGEKTKTK